MNALLKFAQIIVGLARELADENAYERYLAETGRKRSGEEWRRFSDARLRRKYQSGKCC
jgi:hypothetical protein